MSIVIKIGDRNLNIATGMKKFQDGIPEKKDGIVVDSDVDLYHIDNTGFFTPTGDIIYDIQPECVIKLNDRTVSSKYFTKEKPLCKILCPYMDIFIPINAQCTCILINNPREFMSKYTGSVNIGILNYSMGVATILDKETDENESYKPIECECIVDGDHIEAYKQTKIKCTNIEYVDKYQPRFLLTRSGDLIYDITPECKVEIGHHQFDSRIFTKESPLCIYLLYYTRNVVDKQIKYKKVYLDDKIRREIFTMNTCKCGNLTYSGGRLN